MLHLKKNRAIAIKLLELISEGGELLMVNHNRTNTQSKFWWQNMVMYQIYPRSFYDTDDDGIGDVKGIIAKLDYIKSLGVNIIWLNPIFASPQVDNGYDISDYHEIDPIFGDMKDVEQLIKEAHKRKIKVCFDFVLNHTSDQHRWFQEAIKSKDSPYRNYYIFKDGKSDGSAPNNWEGFFTGSTWDKEPNGEQYYFHLFAKEMPDLNWENPKVIQNLIDIACFWAGKGIDGFRLDAFIHVKKHEDFPDIVGLEPGEIAIHEPYFANRPEVPGLIKKFTDGVRERFPNIFFLGEGASATPELTALYSDPERTGIDTVITFKLFTLNNTTKNANLDGNMQNASLDIAAFKNMMREYHNYLNQRGGPVLYWNNHDMARAVSRFGDDNYFRANSAKMLATMMYLQGGPMVLMYGEEIGMKNLRIQTLEEINSPEALNFAREAVELGYNDAWILESISANTKDASRGIMQWGLGDYGDFSNVEPWTGINIEPDFTVANEEQDILSVLHYYRAIIKLRQDEPFYSRGYYLEPTGDELYVYRRYNPNTGEIALVINNFSKKAIVYNYPPDITLEHYHVVLENIGNRVDYNYVTLAPFGSVVLTNSDINSVVPTASNISHTHNN